jgi:3-oxoacyl-[acyl-carrier-protein] synthase-3
MITIENVTITGIAATVPEDVVHNIDLSSVYGAKETQDLINSIGVEKRHVCNDKVTTSDLCLDSAQRLLQQSAINPTDINAVIFVSQTADYQLPATACILQDKLNIPKTCLAFDVNLGCSGYVYGLFLASSLVQSGVGRVLLLVGDTSTTLTESGDRSTELLFGDAGTATIVEASKSGVLHFELGTDGSGFEHIITRRPQPPNNKPIRGLRSAYSDMNGGEVFAFTLKVVPKLINNFLQTIEHTNEDIDVCVYHQANRFMLKHLAKKSKFSSNQVPLSIVDYGNTSSASIPLTLCSQAMEQKNKVLMVGFGVGLSWGVALADLSKTLLLPVNEIPGEQV